MNTFEKTIAQYKKNWPARNPQNYRLAKKRYSFGDRFVLIPINDDVNEELQTSRSFGVNETTSKMKLHEIVKITKENSDNFSQIEIERMKEATRHCDDKRGFFEIGFRTPNVMKLASESFQDVGGCDICRLNVEITKKIGYNVFVHDIMSNDEIKYPFTPSIIVMYHVLEHTHNPEFVLQKIKRSVNGGTILHVEIPIQPGIPDVEHGHLFAFEQRDLGNILLETGWEIVKATREKYTSDDVNERYVARAI